jgi:hypothetical protein
MPAETEVVASHSTSQESAPPAPDNTMRDVGSLDPDATLERAALSEEALPPPPPVAPARTPLRVEGTQELDGEDILEVEEIAAALEAEEEEEGPASLDVFEELAPKKKNPVAALLERARGVAKAKQDVIDRETRARAAAEAQMRARAEAEARARAAAEAAARAQAEAVERARVMAEQARQRQMQQSFAPPPVEHPSSITPMAVDVSPVVSMPPAARMPSFPVVSVAAPVARGKHETTQTYLTQLPLKRPSFEAYVAAGALAACALGAVALLAVLGISRGAASSEAAATRVARPAVIAAASEGSIQKPASGPEKGPGGIPASATTTTSTSAAESISTASLPAAPARPAAPRYGVIKVSPLLRGILVDGSPHAVRGGSVPVTCGRHTVKSPGGAPHTVEVPCGGSTSI